MLRAISKLLSLATVLVIGLICVMFYEHQTQEQRHLAELESERSQLKRVVERLTDERRVAEMLMTGQKIVDGTPQTTLLFLEYARNGTPLPPKYFTILGDQVHLDAMVIKFDRDFIEKDDPLRGHSLALFTRIFGNKQTPDQGAVIDVPDRVPDYYQGTNPQISAFETELWKNFWKLADDRKYRESKGIRVSDGEGKWWPCQPDRLYTITIESAGGLNVTFEPVKGIYREALRQK